MISARVSRGAPARLGSYRLRNVVAAVLLAALAAVLTLAYASHVRRQAAKPAPVAQADVLVATRDIAPGTPTAQILDDHWAKTVSLAQADVVQAAVASPAQLRGLVVTQPIYAGEQISARRLGQSGAAGLGASFSGTFRVFQLPGDADQLLAGSLHQGDHVDVLASIKDPESSDTHYAKVVLRDLLVLSAPATSGGSATSIGGQSQASVKLEVTDEQAQRLFWVEKNADWALLLRPTRDAQSTQAAPASAATLVGGAK